MLALHAVEPKAAGDPAALEAARLTTRTALAADADTLQAAGRGDMAAVQPSGRVESGPGQGAG